MNKQFEEAFRENLEWKLSMTPETTYQNPYSLARLIINEIGDKVEDERRQNQYDQQLKGGIGK